MGGIYGALLGQRQIAPIATGIGFGLGVWGSYLVWRSAPAPLHDGKVQIGIR